jgi:hypothetical protein
MHLLLLAGLLMLSVCRAQETRNRFLTTSKSIAQDIDALKRASKLARTKKQRGLRQSKVQESRHETMHAHDVSIFISYLTETQLQLGTLQQRRHSALQEVLSENVVPELIQTIFDVIRTILKIIENFFFNILELIQDIITLAVELIQQFIQIIINFILKILTTSLQIIVGVVNAITSIKPKPSTLSAPSFAGAFDDIEAEIVDPGMKNALLELEMDTMELEDAIGVMVNTTESAIDGGIQEGDSGLTFSPVGIAVDVNELTNEIVFVVVDGLITALDFVVTTEIDQRAEIAIEGLSGTLTSVVETEANKIKSKVGIPPK